MAKRRKDTRRPPRAGARDEQAPIRDFRIPQPKGVRLDPATLPKSTQWRAADADPEEAAAFGMLPPAARTRARATQEDVSALTAARRRMLGVREDEGDEEMDADTETDADLDARDEIEREVEQQIGKQRQAQLQEEREKLVRDMARTPMSPFQAELAKPTAAPNGHVFSRSIPTLHVRRVTIEDTDRLWDWLRTDTGAVTQFLGRVHTTSRSLHELMSFMILTAEAQGQAIIRAVYNGDPHHLGFAMLAPILAEESTALMHIYLRPEVRGHFHQFLAPLVEIAEQVVPGFHLAAMAMDPAIRRWHRQVLGPLGFVEHVVFVR